MTGKGPGRGPLGLSWGLQRAQEGHGLVWGDGARLCGWWWGEGARRPKTGGPGLLKPCLGRSGPTVQGGAGGRLQGSPGSVPRDVEGRGGRELGFCSLSRGSLGLRLPDREVGRLGGGPRLTQQCLGAAWESLILPGNDGGPRPCVSDHPFPGAPSRLRPPTADSAPTPWRPLHLE